MEYKPTKEDLAFAKDVYDKVIFTQTLNPILVKEAHRRLFGFEAINGQQAKIKVSTYFMYTYKAVDETETAEIQTPSIVGESSHSEDLQPDEMSELELLEAKYELATDSNEKRSLKMKINKLKKQQDGN